MAAKRKARDKVIREKFLPDSVNKVTATRESGLLDQPFTSSQWSNQRRISNCSEARELYTRLYLENQLRANAFGQIRNQIEGGRPFDPGELMRNGEGWRTNCNFNDARSAYRRISRPYWRMVHEVPRKISVSVHAPDTDVDKWNAAFEQCFDLFIDDWGPDYLLQFSGWSGDYVMYGTGHAMWPDEETPRYVWMPTVQILLPKRTKANIDKWELVCLKRELTADELLKHTGRSEDSRRKSVEAGWNPEMVDLAIRMAAPGPAQTRYFDPNFWQDMIVSNDLVIGGVWPPVTVIDMWAKTRESDDIFHYIFTEKSDVGDYLYEAKEGTNTFRHLMATAFYDAGSNGLYHSIKGFGVMNYYYATVINRTKCRLVDSATFSMGMNFVKGDNTPEQTPPVENYSMLNIFPTGLTQLQWYPQLQNPMELLGTLEQSQTENNFTYNEPSKDIADTKTARQAVILSNIANEMSTADSSIFLSQVGTNFFSECFRRLRKKGSSDPDAKKFRKRCIAMGVPEEVMDDEELFEITVKSGASPTTSSPVAREQIGKDLLTEIYPLPSANRRAIEEFVVANKIGADGVKRFLLPVGVDSDPMARRQAIMENQDMAVGVQLPVDPSDAHVEHCDEHLKPLEAILNAVQPGALQAGQPGQGMQPQQPPQQMTPAHLMALEMTIPHIAQHLTMLSGNKAQAQQYKALNARFKAVVSIEQGIMSRLARAQAKAQQTGQPLQPQDVSSAMNSAQQ